MCAGGGKNIAMLELRPIWKGLPGKFWLWGCVLACLLAGFRIGGMLGPSHLRWLLPFGFIVMMALPWVFLTGEGRNQIGLAWPVSRATYVSGLMLGIGSAFGCFVIGWVLFGKSSDNWFVSIANNYRQTLDTTGFTSVQLHLIFTLPALFFSPLGEELFFRGLFQQALEERFSVLPSTVVECGFFGIVHLCHHGLSRSARGLVFQPLSGFLWVCLMFGTAFLFATVKKKSNSLAPAIISHAAFNLTMNFLIFSFLW